LRAAVSSLACERGSIHKKHFMRWESNRCVKLYFSPALRLHSGDIPGSRTDAD
jgi:hypothetical protein